MKTIMNNFEVTAESMHYEPTTDSVVLQEATDESGFRRTAIVKMDEYIRNEVSSMMAKL